MPRAIHAKGQGLCSRFVKHRPDSPRDLVDLGQTVDHGKLAPGIVIADEGRGLLVVFQQTLTQAVCIVIGAALQIVRTTDITRALDLRRLGDVVVDLAAIAAGKTPGDALDRYDTQGGVLYRRRGLELEPIRDFTDMAFEPMRAPYDWRDANDPAEPAPWHPLDGDAPS